MYVQGNLTFLNTSLWALLSVRWSVCVSVGWSVCHNFLKGCEVKLLYSYRSTCLFSAYKLRLYLLYVHDISTCAPSILFARVWATENTWLIIDKHCGKREKRNMLNWHGKNYIYITYLMRKKLEILDIGKKLSYPKKGK